MYYNKKYLCIVYIYIYIIMDKYIVKLKDSIVNKNDYKKNKYLKKILKGGTVCTGKYKDDDFIGVCENGEKII
jgi:hypothetical protein